MRLRAQPGQDDPVPSPACARDCCILAAPGGRHDHIRADVRDQRANRTGVYLAVLQLVFTLGWTTYVIYLPKLCADVGIAPAAVILILMLDQAIFTVTDTAMGIAADKIARICRQAGRVRRRRDRDLLRGVCCAAVCGRAQGRARRPGSSG